MNPPHSIELRHLRYFVALADAGSFTQAAERIFVAQPTLSQQIRRLEEIVGAQLLQRGREGIRLTRAGTVLLDASRNVLSLVDYEVDRARHVASLGRQRIRVVLPPRLPETLAVAAASALRLAAAWHPAAGRGTIRLAEVAGLDVIYAAPDQPAVSIHNP